MVIFSGALTDEDVMALADILHHGLGEGVTGHLDGGGLHDAGQGDDSDVGGAAADVDHHVAVGLGDVNAGADGGSQRLLDQVHPAGTGLNAGVDDGTLFDLGDAGGHANDQTGLEQADGGHLADELTEHTLGHIVVGNDALTEGTDGHDIAGGTAQHLLGIGAHLQQLAGVLVQGDHGGLPQDDALILYKDQYAGGTKVDADVFCKHVTSPQMIFPAARRGSLSSFQFFPHRKMAAVSQFSRWDFIILDKVSFCNGILSKFKIVYIIFI